MLEEVGVGVDKEGDLVGVEVVLAPVGGGG